MKTIRQVLESGASLSDEERVIHALIFGKNIVSLILSCNGMESPPDPLKLSR